MVRQTVQPRILGKIGEELEIIEEKTIAEEKEIKEEEIKEEKSRNRGRWQWDGQYGWPILQVVEKFLRTRKLKREVVLWLGKNS